MPKSLPVRVRRWQATVILTLFFTAVAGAAAVGWWYARESPPHQGPIVVITVDGLSASALAPRADSASETPALAALAADAVVFDRAYTHSPQILPAHASLLSGLLPFEHGVRDDAGFTLEGSVRTLPELLRNRGFATGAAMSSFLLRNGTGVSQGFSFFDADIEGGAAVTRPGSLTLDAAETWARARKDRRYFLLVQVTAADAELGVERLVRLLQEKNWYKTSTIVLVGDRGRTEPAAALDEESLRVPLLIKQPDQEGASRRVSTAVQHIDLVPTILDLVRAPVPNTLHGRSLVSVLRNKDDRVDAQPIYSEWLEPHFRFGAPPAFALTVNGSRYVRSGVEEILDVAVDAPPVPGETAAAPQAIAVVDDPSERITPMRATLDRLIADRIIEDPVAPPEAIRNRLALAGYLPGLTPLMPDADAGGGDLRALQTIASEHEAAAQLAGEQRLAAALRALQVLARSHPDLASVHYQIGLLSLRIGRPTAALAALQTAAELRPDAPEIPRVLALTLARGGEADAAREQAVAAVDLARASGASALAAAYETSARVSLILGEADAALAAADAAQAADPGVPMRAFVEGRLHLAAGEYMEAATLLQEATNMRAAQGAPLEGLDGSLGEALAALGRTPEAKAAFEREIASFPDGIDAYTRLAMLYSGPEQLADVERVLNELLAVVATPDAYAAAARTWAELGQRARAEAVRSDARARFRGDQPQTLLARERPR